MRGKGGTGFVDINGLDRLLFLIFLVIFLFQHPIKKKWWIALVVSLVCLFSLIGSMLTGAKWMQWIYLFYPIFLLFSVKLDERRNRNRQDKPKTEEKIAPVKKTYRRKRYSGPPKTVKRENVSKSLIFR